MVAEPTDKSTKMAQRFQEAQKLYERGKYKRAFTKLRDLADENYTPALLPLAQMYQRGWGVDDPDPREAVRLYEGAATAAKKTGDKQAMTVIAETYEQQRGLNPDPHVEYFFKIKAARLRQRIEALNQQEGRPPLAEKPREAQPAPLPAPRGSPPAKKMRHHSRRRVEEVGQRVVTHPLVFEPREEATAAPYATGTWKLPAGSPPKEGAAGAYATFTLREGEGLDPRFAPPDGLPEDWDPDADAEGTYTLAPMGMRPPVHAWDKGGYATGTEAPPAPTRTRDPIAPAPAIYTATQGRGRGRGQLMEDDEEDYLTPTRVLGRHSTEHPRTSQQGSGVRRFPGSRVQRT